MSYGPALYYSNTLFLRKKGVRKYTFAQKCKTMTVKNVIFDLGGVFIPLDMKATSDGFKSLGAESFDNIYGFLKQDSFFDDFDKGLISEVQFRNKLKPYLRSGVTDNEIDKAWNAMLGVIPPEKVDFINEVGKSYNTILLSNTNTIHVRQFLQMHHAAYGDGTFSKLFHHIFYSCNTGMRKPDFEIFEHVMNRTGSLISETIFIDDSPHHVIGALSGGLTAFHLNTAKENIQSLFARIV